MRPRRGRRTVRLASLAFLVAAIASCSGASDSSSGERSARSSTTSTRRAAPTSTSYPRVSRPAGSQGLVWDACFELRRNQLQLIALGSSLQIYDQDYERRFILASMSKAADLARQGDANLAAAITTWMSKTTSGLNDQELGDALRVVGATCGEFGLDRGLPGELPSEPNTAEFGRVRLAGTSSSTYLMALCSPMTSPTPWTTA